ncbi:MAG TPA: hypothetical protein VFW17_13430 [Ktedonobacterales bacterium]|jgi:hypothetical protein|nr:hypothetical protein [Ktedonobacterales bacterium]
MIQTLLVDPVAFILVILLGLGCVYSVFGGFLVRWYWTGVRLPYYEMIAQEQGHISAADFRTRYGTLKRRVFGGLTYVTCMFAVGGLVVALILASSVHFSSMAQHPVWVFLIFTLSLLLIVAPVFRVWFVNERDALMRLRDPNAPAAEM